MTTPPSTASVKPELPQGLPFGVSHLSKRGRANLMAPNETFLALMEVLANAYDKETSPGGIISMGIAENGLMHEELVEYFNSNLRLQPRHLTYGDGATGSVKLRYNLARFANTYFNPLVEVQPEEILVSSGCTGVLDQLAWGICNEGEGVLIGRPVYSGFVTDLDSRSKAVPVAVAFGDIDPFSVESVKCYEEHLQVYNARGTKIRAMIVTNPHNPLGKCYPIKTIQAYLHFCQQHNIHFISDEIYALSTFTTRHNGGAVPFHSILSLDTTPFIDPTLVHVLYGMSKDFAANGFRLGLLITRNRPLHHAMSSITPFSWPSAPADLLWSTMLEDTNFLSWYVEENRRRLGEAYDLLTDVLDTYGIEYVRGGNAGFYIWCDFGFAAVPAGEQAAEGKRKRRKITVAEDKALNRRIILGGVYLATSQGYQGEEPGWYRVTFSLPKPILMLGLKRLLKVLKGVDLEIDGNGDFVPDGAGKVGKKAGVVMGAQLKGDIEEEVARLSVGA